MGRPTYSIRKGFEYQDLFCSFELLKLIEEGDLQASFQIESDEIHHTNDLLLKPSKGPTVACQVKFHTTQQHYDTFDSLVNKDSEKSNSLLKKLYVDWRKLSNNGETQCEIRFISSNPAEPGDGRLGSAINTENGKINKFFLSQTRFARHRKTWCQHLELKENELCQFLKNVTWRFAYRSIAELRKDIAEELRRIGLPYGEEAVILFEAMVSKIATQECGDMQLTELVTQMWERPMFREACEQVFSEITPGLKDKKRVSTLKVVAISIESLPAFTSKEFACLEEPVPMINYRYGITVPILTGTFDNLRGRLHSQYMNWQKIRLKSILNQLESYEPDLVVFPRLSVPIEVAEEICRWGSKNKCNVAIGGHTFIVDSSSSEYGDGINTSVKEKVTASKENSNLIIDVVLRHDRAGRYTISEIQSPHSKTESVKTEINLFELPCHDGWLTAVSLPSTNVVKKFLSAERQSPEIIIFSCNIHGNNVHEALAQNEKQTNIPYVISQSNTNVRSAVGILEQSDSLVTGDQWEGAVFAEINYTRGPGQRWTASVKSPEKVPIVYHEKGCPSESKEIEEWAAQLEGFQASVIQARLELKGQKSTDKIILLSCEDPITFFYNRATEAEQHIRSKIGKLEIAEVKHLAETLKEIGEIKQQKYSSSRQKPQLPELEAKMAKYPVRQPILVNRTNELRTVSRFLEGVDRKRILFISGPPGIGKRALLSDVQRKDDERNRWLRIRCVEDSDLAEAMGQILITLCEDVKEPPSLNLATYDKIWYEISRRRYRVVVFEDAHNLPIGEDHKHHAEFIAFLSSVCRGRFDHDPRVIFTSDWRGNLVFSGSHLLGELRVPGIEDPDMVRMLQECIALRPSKYPTPTSTELEQIAAKIHGYPILAEIVTAILEKSSTSDVIGTLHERKEVRDYVIHRLLGRAQIPDAEREFLLLAATFRIPVHKSAFARLSGARSREIMEDLSNRFLLGIEGNNIKLHPLLAEHFARILTDESDGRRLHRIAYNYFEGKAGHRRLTLNERIELVYHGINAKISIPLEDLKLMTGPLRTTLFSALRKHDWDQVNNCADRILELFPSDPVVRLTKAVSLDAQGNNFEAEKYSDSVTELDHRYLWVGVEFARNKIRLRDFNGAERALSELTQRFGDEPQVQVACAHFLEAQGLHAEAIDTCNKVLSNPVCREWEAFRAGLILKHAGDLMPLIEYVEAKCGGWPGHSRLLCLFSYSCVMTKYAPDEGIRTLGEMWNENPKDGGIVADYAAALSRINRTSDAKKVLERGLKVCQSENRGRRFVLIEYARHLDSEGEYAKAHGQYRELIRQHKHDLHIRRRFAESLTQAAAESHSEGKREFEDACVEEAQRTLKTLLEIAPQDKWAAERLNIVEQRTY